MNEWSSSDLSPKRMWDLLYTNDPQIDEQFYRLPDGRWDVNRLNQGIERLQKEEDMRLQQEREIYHHNQMLRQQKKMAKAEQSYHRKMQRKEQSKEVDLTAFNVGMHLYLWPIMIQILVSILMISLPTGAVISNLYIFLIVILILNLIFWVSIPIMTKQLANQILKLDGRTEKMLEPRQGRW